MTQPLRGTQSLVGQMGWVFERPLLTALEVLWRWAFGIPFVIVVLLEAIKILMVLPPASTGLSSLDPQNPWVAAVQLSNAWTLYQPHVAVVLHWLLPAAAVTWVIVSALGRNLLLKQMDPALHFRPFAMIVLQTAWLALFLFTCFCWLRSIAWVAAATITPAAEPDLIGFSIGIIFLSLGFFTAWALLSWALSIAPLLMLLEDRAPLSALCQSLRLGKPMTAKLVEINLVMGIVRLALIVLAMVLSAAPLPFSDQLGPDALHIVWAAATLFFLVACDYFHVVRLKGFVEFWKMFRLNRKEPA
jgi:hypothetical protein